MSQKIAEAYVEISARMDRMEADLKAAQSKFSAATSKMAKSAGGLEAKMQSLKGVYAAVSAVIAGAFVKSIVSAINETANYLDAIDEMSAKTGVSVETLTSFDLAAKKAGIDLNTFATSMRMLYRSANEANEGTKESVQAYKRLGVAVKDAAGNLKSGETLFIEVADALDKISNPAEKSAMAMKVFGRAGAEMIPMLEGGAEAIRGYVEEAKKLGLVFTKDDVDKGVAYADMMDNFSARLTAVKRNLALEVIPTFEKLLAMLSGAPLSASTKKPMIQEQIEELEKKIAERQQFLERLRKTTAGGKWPMAAATIPEKEDELRVLNSQLSDKRNELASLEKEIAMKRAARETKPEKKPERTTAPSEEQKSAYAEKTDRLVNEQKARLNELAALSQEIAARRKEAEAMAAKSTALGAIQGRIEALAGEHKAKVSELSALSQEIAERKEQADALAGTASADTGKSEEIQKRINALVEVQSGRAAEIEALNKELSARTAEIAGLGDGGKMIAVQKKIEALVAEQAAKIAELAALNKEIDMRKSVKGLIPAQLEAVKAPEYIAVQDKDTKEWSAQLKNAADAYGRIAERSRESALQIRGATGYAGELIGAFQELDENIINTSTTLEDNLLGPFSSMMDDLQSQWASTISEFLRGGQTFGDFMASMFGNVMDSFTDMLANMAAQWLANQIFSSVSGFSLGGGLKAGPEVASTFNARTGTSVVINAVDAQSFDDALRRNAASVTNIVYESQNYGRAS